MAHKHGKLIGLHALIAAIMFAQLRFEVSSWALQGGWGCHIERFFLTRGIFYIVTISA